VSEAADLKRNRRAESSAEEGVDLLQAQGLISGLDLHFARFMARLAKKNQSLVALSAALVSSSTKQGHICLDLSAIAGKPLVAVEEQVETVSGPELEDWIEELEESGVVGRPGEHKPLILDERARLYLYRYWEYQERLAESIRERAEGIERPRDTRMFEHMLSTLFPGDPSHGNADMQKVAAFTAFSKRFCVISGGPGTGKTTTVAKILALLVEQAQLSKVRIALASPTGKGAARLQEAIRGVKEILNHALEMKDVIPSDASTIHRLLGPIKGSPYFRHNEANLLSVDAVVVDEASMVDLALMSKLVQAIPRRSRLILLGDKDQLASVEAGAVLGDICDIDPSSTFSRAFFEELHRVTGYSVSFQGKRVREIRDCIVQLEKSYRFTQESGIALLSELVNRGDADAAMDCIASGRYQDVQWKPLPEQGAFARAIREKILANYGDYPGSSDPGECLRMFERFRILCAVRQGPYGIGDLNVLAEKILRDKGVIRPERGYYAGKPVMITTNDYGLELYNGDVGMILEDPAEGNDLRVFFPEEGGGFRKIYPARLPEHETVYSMTVHKSQGSEFDRVMLILPDRDTPLLTRELLYTAITRARESVELWCKEDIFRAAVSRRTERRSGLRDALWR